MEILGLSKRSRPARTVVAPTSMTIEAMSDDELLRKEALLFLQPSSPHLPRWGMATEFEQEFKSMLRAFQCGVVLMMVVCACTAVILSFRVVYYFLKIVNPQRPQTPWQTCASS